MSVLALLYPTSESPLTASYRPFGGRHGTSAADQSQRVSLWKI